MNKAYKAELTGLVKTSDIDFSKFNNKTILFTGASGLIGRYFVDTLMSANEIFGLKIKVIALDQNEETLKLVFSDYLNDSLFLPIAANIVEPLDIKERVDYIIHAASPANPYFYANFPVDVIKANIIGSINMLELCRKNENSKMVFISSGEVYGSQVHDGNGYREDQPGVVNSSIVRSCYTESKRCSETAVVCYAQQYNCYSMIARLSFVYGPTYSPRDTRVVFQFLNNYLNNEDIVLKSAGTQVRTYTYVSDCVTGLLTLLLNGEKGEAYNIATPKSVVSVKQIGETIVNASKGRLKLIVTESTENEKAGYSPFENAVQNADKLISVGWKPSVQFKEGIDRIIKIKSEE